MTRFLISVPEAMRETLKTEAKKEGQTLTGLIRIILRDWLNAQK